MMFIDAEQLSIESVELRLRHDDPSLIFTLYPRVDVDWSEIWTLGSPAIRLHIWQARTAADSFCTAVIQREQESRPDGEAPDTEANKYMPCFLQACGSGLPKVVATALDAIVKVRSFYTQTTCPELDFRVPLFWHTEFSRPVIRSMWRGQHLVMKQWHTSVRDLHRRGLILDEVAGITVVRMDIMCWTPNMMV